MKIFEGKRKRKWDQQISRIVEEKSGDGKKFCNVIFFEENFQIFKVDVFRD